MPTFLTVSEAALLTGKSSSSIRRVIYPITKDDKHPDRPQILPSPEEVLQLRLKGENFAWRLSEELLLREIPIDGNADKESNQASSGQPADAETELLSMLRRELDIKNQQITQQAAMLSQQMELISGLSERLREGNMLIGSLQQQLTLADGSARSKSTIDATTSRATTQSKAKGESVAISKRSEAKVANGKPAAEKNAAKPSKQKRGFFSGFFHRP